MTATKFNAHDKLHRSIVIGAIAAADAFGAGRLSAAKAQLEMNDITAYSTTAERDDFERLVFDLGAALDRETL